MFYAFVAVVCHLGVFCFPVIAQDGSASGAIEAGGQLAAASPDAAASPIEELPIYLRDKDGNLIAMPGFSWEDFKKYYDLKHQIEQREQRPRHSLQRLTASGTAGETHAELTIRVGILVRQDGWVRVPLYFDRALLREPAKYEGTGEGFVDLAEGGAGHVGWIRGKAGEQHQLTLEMSVPLDKIGNETRLKMVVPRATTSQLSLKVPLAGAEGEVSQGATLQTTFDAAVGETEFAVLWQGGDLQLSWREPGGPLAEKPTVLTAEGTILARIDKFSADMEATLVVRGSGAPFDRCHVRLPPGAKLLPEELADPTVTVTPDETEKDLVEVVRVKKEAEPITVRLTTRRPHSADKPDEWFELAGFEVVEASRQSGHVAIAVTGDRQVRWRCSRGIEQIEVDQMPDLLRRKDVVAGFEYFHFSQTGSLSCRLVSQTMRIGVEPLYKLLVDADQVRLEAELKYTIRGGKAFQLDVGLSSDWELDAVGPENLVAVDQVAVIDSNVLSIPLSQPSTGQIELWFRARRAIAEDAKLLKLPLPEPLVNSPGPATVVVVPNDNVELTPDRVSTSGLTLQPVDPLLELPPRQQPPLFYRGEPAKACFAADFRVLVQSLAVEVTGQITLDRQAAGVEQKLAYTIAHVPADHFIVEVPRSLGKSNGLEFEHDSQVLSCADLPEAAAPEHVTGPVRKRVALPQACIGACELVVRYQVPLPSPTANKPTALAIPLVMPGEGELSSNRLLVGTAAGVEVEVSPSTSGWSVSQNGAGPSGHGRPLQLAAEGHEEQVGLVVRLANEVEAATTIIERAWVQTWLSHSARQDRAVFRFSSNRKELQVTLPAGTVAGQVQVLLDGKRVAERVIGEDRLMIPLSANSTSGDSSHRRYVLELDYYFPGRRPGPGRLSIEVPRLGDPQLNNDVWIRRAYWQLVLPQNEHVVAAPRGVVDEYVWRWDGYFWQRKPLLGQAELEAWVGVSRRDPIPEEQVLPVHQGANFYLFSSLGSVDRYELRTAGRTWIVLFASGAALVGGLLLIYVPVSRHPAVLFGTGLLLLGIGLLNPEPALLAAQAASLGLALALLAGLLERSVARRRREPILPDAPDVILDKGSTEVQYQLPVADNQVSTRAAPPPVEPPPDSNA